MDRLAEIQKALHKGFPMVMHGSTSVPEEWVDRVNAAGGKMKNSSGVPEDQYLPAAKLGVCKVNIDTDGRLVWCAVYRETFRDKPEDFDPRTRANPSWPSMPSTSPRNTRSSVRPANWNRSARPSRSTSRGTHDRVPSQTGAPARELSQAQSV